MVTDQIAACLTALQLPNALEPVLERRNALNGGKRGDLVCRGLHSNGDGVVVDVNIVDPTANEMACMAAKETGGAVALRARQEKVNIYDLVCKERGLAFQPLIFETSGFLDKSVRPSPRTSPIRSPSLQLGPRDRFDSTGPSALRLPYTRETRVRTQEPPQWPPHRVNPESNP
jgi:hypothetical protein